MYVDTRSVGEGITIQTPHGEVVVRVHTIRHDKVRLEIEAPNTLPVHRGEVYEAIRRDFANCDRGGG